MSTIRCWRIFCITENTWVESWSLSEPTTCINNTGHTINSNSSQVINIIEPNTVKVVNSVKDTLDVSITAQKKSIICLKSFHGLNNQNIVSTTGNGTVTAYSEVTSEIELNVSTSSDTSKIRSKKRGYYIAGFVSQCGVAMRLPSGLDTTQVLKFGYFDNSNGYYFKVTSTEFSVCILNDYIETEITRNNFNQNRLDGTEQNGITLDLSKGNIFRIDFTWYGYGNVNFGVIQTNSNLEQKLFQLHKYDVIGRTSCKNPNLPINVSSSAGTSNVSKSVFIGGRQYSIIGNVERSLSNSMYYLHNSSGTLNVLKPLFSFRYKSNCKSFCAEINKIFGTVNTNAIIQIIQNPTLNSPSFGTNSYIESSCLDIDSSSTTVSGTVIETYLIIQDRPIDIESKYELYEDYTYTIAWKVLDNNLVGNKLSLQVNWMESF